MAEAWYAHALESRAMRALGDLQRMRHATRALLSERAPLAGLARRWEDGVARFTDGFQGLDGGAGGAELKALREDWQAISTSVAPGRQALRELCASPLAGQVGDEGVEQTTVRLMADRTATADLLLLRRLERHLGGFDRATGVFAQRLDAAVLRLGERAARTARLAAGCSLLLLLGAIAAVTWLLVRMSRLHLGLVGVLESLRQSQRDGERREAMLRCVLDALGDGVVLVGSDGRVQWANPALRRLAGEGALEVGRPEDLDLRDREGQPIRPPPGGPERRWLDARLGRSGATDLPVDLSAVPIRFGDQSAATLLVISDLSERRVLEDQLRQAQSLETLGRLAGGVAHDFNNLLAGILGNAELLGSQLADRPSQRQRIDTIITASTRAAVLTRQLLESARRSAMQRGPLDLHALIRTSVALIERSFDRRIHVVLGLDAADCWVDGDAGLLQNALTNLAVNSRDAMPQGGQLTIATRGVPAPGGEGDPWIELSVADQGVGIPPEVLPRIFEPFFTTKPVGKGTGLGLAAVLGTVTRHGGRIAVDSRPGSGTRFTILLPCCRSPETGLVRRPGQPDQAATALRVLIADDEELVRTIASDQLAELGCQVRTVVDGAAAVAAVRAEPAAFDLVILDVVMPRMGGVEAHRELRRLAPRLPILMWSGYSGGQDVEPLLADGRTVFITKPASRRQIEEALAQLRRGG
jgi:signal transduction histidine kinase/ActR/RegA family two-component response regulator